MQNNTRLNNLKSGAVNYYGAAFLFDFHEKKNTTDNIIDILFN